MPPPPQSLVAVDCQGLRGFLAMVEREFPDELLRIRTPVSTHLEMTSLVFELERAGKSPVVVYENVEGHTIPVVTNIAEGDHLGIGDIETVEQLARVKRTIVDVVAPEGHAILKADDPLVAEMASYCPGSVVFFALTPA